VAERPGFAAYKLPSGRHGLPLGLVAESRRWRLLGAAGEIIAAAGPEGLTAAAVSQRAGVSKSAFYSEFENVEDCLRATCAAAGDLLEQMLAEAAEAEGEDRSRFLETALRQAQLEPSLLALLSPAAAAASPRVAVLREGVMRRAAARVSSRAGDGCLLAAALQLLLMEGPSPEGSQDPLPQLVRLLRWILPSATSRRTSSTRSGISATASAGPRTSASG
jgi:AcrR family transcriptional regulator